MKFGVQAFIRKKQRYEKKRSELTERFNFYKSFSVILNFKSQLLFIENFEFYLTFSTLLKI